MVHVSGGLVTKENPPASLDNQEESVQSWLVRTGAKLIFVAACHENYTEPEEPIYEKSSPSCSTVHGPELVGRTCPLWPRCRQRFGGKKDSMGGYVSQATARYKQRLAKAIAAVVRR